MAGTGKKTTRRCLWHNLLAISHAKAQRGQERKGRKGGRIVVSKFHANTMLLLRDWIPVLFTEYGTLSTYGELIWRTLFAKFVFDLTVFLKWRSVIAELGIWETFDKTAVLTNAAFGKTLTEFGGKGFGYILYDLITVICPMLALLYFFHDTLTNQPICFYHSVIDCFIDFISCFSEDMIG
jgi:hypothetical protein